MPSQAGCPVGKLILAPAWASQESERQSCVCLYFECFSGGLPALQLGMCRSVGVSLAGGKSFSQRESLINVMDFSQIACLMCEALTLGFYLREGYTNNQQCVPAVSSFLLQFISPTSWKVAQRVSVVLAAQSPFCFLLVIISLLLLRELPTTSRIPLRQSLQGCQSQYSPIIHRVGI